MVMQFFNAKLHSWKVKIFLDSEISESFKTNVDDIPWKFDCILDFALYLNAINLIKSGAVVTYKSDFSIIKYLAAPRLKLPLQESRL